MVTSKQFSYYLVTVKFPHMENVKISYNFTTSKFYKQRVEQYDYAVFRLLVGYFLVNHIL